jgi:hypothetical protein
MMILFYSCLEGDHKLARYYLIINLLSQQFCNLLFNIKNLVKKGIITQYD